MLCQNERGVQSGSDCYLATPSETARKYYYYLMQCGHYHCEAGYEIRRQSAGCLLLMYIKQGTLRIEYGGRHTAAQAGDAVLLDCYKPHRYYAEGHLEFYWMHIDGANAVQLCGFLSQDTGCAMVSGKNAAAIEAQMYQLISLFRNQQHVSEAVCSRSIYSMLCELMPDAAVFEPSAAQDTPIGRTLSYIREHLGEPLTLAELAGRVQLSVYYFTRVFKKQTGYSPYEYIIIARINHAKYLLKNTAHSIKEISAIVGYSSEISFISAFTQKVGISPGKFRKFPLG